MPGPLGPTGPTTDPNWGWNTIGWTNQGNLGGDVEGQSLSAPGQGSMLIEPAALSGYIARTLDPDVTSAGVGAITTATFVSGTPLLYALQVMEPAATTGVVVAGNTAGPPTHSIAALYNASSGALVVTTGDLLTAGFGTTTAKIAWTAATALAPGYYWVLLAESGGTMGKINVYPLATEAQLLLSSTGAPVPYVVGSTPRFGTGSTGMTSITATPAGLATLGTLSSASATMVLAKTANATAASFVALY